VFPKKLLPSERRAHQSGQRVTHVCSGNSFTPKELFLKREYAQDARQALAHGF
jgi:hypothetical protein